MTEQDLIKRANVAVGARIHGLLWAKRISQRAAARALGIDQASISRRLRGATPITAGELFVFAQLLEVDVTDLVNENGPDTLAVKVPGPAVLPRLDSNQQPSGYRSAQVSGVVVELASWRKRGVA